MNLRQYASNCRELCDPIRSVDRAADKLKVLGIQWDTLTDLLLFSGAKVSSEIITKRSVMSVVASVYDPLGYLSAVTLPGKLFVQNLWRNELNWDEELSTEQRSEWSRIVSELCSLSQVSLTRHVGYKPTATCQLHCFTDASAHAFAAVVYLRISDNDTHQSSILFAKNRLAPMKKPTIPRLELLAVFIGVKALNFVQQQLALDNIHIESQFLWCDSLVVLHWLKSNKPMRVFVENRLRTIRQSSALFRYINTSENPADLATRQVSVAQLTDSNCIWWHGPAFLFLNQDQWPQDHIPEVDMSVQRDVQTEYKALVEITAAVADNDSQSSVIEFDRFSQLNRLLRAVVYAIRFLKHLLQKGLTSERYTQLGVYARFCSRISSHSAISAIDLSVAQEFVDSQVQAMHFDLVFDALSMGTRHKLVDSLNLCIDNGLLKS